MHLKQIIGMIPILEFFTSPKSFLIYVFWPVECKSWIHFCRSSAENSNNKKKGFFFFFSGLLRDSGVDRLKKTPDLDSTSSKTS